MRVAFAKATYIFSANIFAYMPYSINDIVSFEQLGPEIVNGGNVTKSPVTITTINLTGEVAPWPLFSNL